MGLGLSLHGVLADDVITDPHLRKEIEEFIESDLDFQIGDPKNQERIDNINRILNLVLRSLDQE